VTITERTFSTFAIHNGLLQDRLMGDAWATHVLGMESVLYADTQLELGAQIAKPTLVGEADGRVFLRFELRWPPPGSKILRAKLRVTPDVTITILGALRVGFLLRDDRWDTIGGNSSFWGVEDPHMEARTVLDALMAKGENEDAPTGEPIWFNGKNFNVGYDWHGGSFTSAVAGDLGTISQRLRRNTDSEPGLNLQIQVRAVVSATDPRETGPVIALSDPRAFDDITAGIEGSELVFSFTGADRIPVVAGQRLAWRLVGEGVDRIPETTDNVLPLFRIETGNLRFAGTGARTNLIFWNRGLSTTEVGSNGFGVYPYAQDLPNPVDYDDNDVNPGVLFEDTLLDFGVPPFSVGVPQTWGDADYDTDTTIPGFSALLQSYIDQPGYDASPGTPFPLGLYMEIKITGITLPVPLFSREGDARGVELIIEYDPPVTGCIKAAVAKEQAVKAGIGFARAVEAAVGSTNAVQRKLGSEPAITAAVGTVPKIDATVGVACK